MRRRVLSARCARTPSAARSGLRGSRRCGSARRYCRSRGARAHPRAPHPETCQRLGLPLLPQCDSAAASTHMRCRCLCGVVPVSAAVWCQAPVVPGTFGVTRDSRFAMRSCGAGAASLCAVLRRRCALRARALTPTFRRAVASTGAFVAAVATSRATAPRAAEPRRAAPGCERSEHSKRGGTPLRKSASASRPRFEPRRTRRGEGTGRRPAKSRAAAKGPVLATALRNLRCPNPRAPNDEPPSARQGIS
jgi:hypothetical protein